MNRNPEHYFAEVEHSAFRPSNIVSGIGGGLTPLMFAVKFGRTRIVELLTARGASLRRRNRLGLSASFMVLHFSVDCAVAFRKLFSNQPDSLTSGGGFQIHKLEDK